MALKIWGVSVLGTTGIVEQNSVCDCVHMCVFFFCVMERQNHFSDFYAKDMSVIF